MIRIRPSREVETLSFSIRRHNSGREQIGSSWVQIGGSRAQNLSRYVVRTPSDGVSGRPVWAYSLHGFQITLLNFRLALVIKKLSKHQNLTHFLLELIARVLNMLIGLKGDNYYSKVFKRVNYKLSNSTFWVVIKNHIGQRHDRSYMCGLCQKRHWIIMTDQIKCQLWWKTNRKTIWQII